MKKTKIITLTLLMAGLVATGCTKPEQDENAAKGIKIFANDFAGNGSKVYMNPANPAEAATWIAGEPITLNGEHYYVGQGENNHFFIINSITRGTQVLEDKSNQVEPEEGTALVSFYPGETFGNVNGNTGNVVEVRDANGDDEYDEIVLSNLEIGFDGSTQSMAFPMVATASAGAHELYYNHLTAGLQLTLHNNTNAAVNVDKLIIVAQNTDEEEVVNLGINGYTARWELENVGPWLPMGAVGENEDQIDVRFSSVMNFTFKNGPHSIAAATDLVFCVPITINHLNSIRVYGYDQSGNVIFQKYKAFGGDGIDVVRNRMYSLPPIGIGNAE